MKKKERTKIDYFALTNKLIGKRLYGIEKKKKEFMKLSIKELADMSEKFNMMEMTAYSQILKESNVMDLKINQDKKI